MSYLQKRIQAQHRKYGIRRSCIAYGSSRKINYNLTEGAMLAQNKSGWKLIKYIDIKEEDIGQYHNVIGRYLLNYESVDFTGFS